MKTTRHKPSPQRLGGAEVWKQKDFLSVSAMKITVPKALWTAVAAATAFVSLVLRA
jgi:hypothetical protein